MGGTEVISLNDVEIGRFANCVMAYGHFSTIHPGHIRYLRHAKDAGNCLVVCLMGDADGTFPYNEHERSEALAMLGIADAVIMLKSSSLSESIDVIKPRLLVLGTEFKESNKLVQTTQKFEAEGGKVLYHAGDVTYASASLLVGSESQIENERVEQFRKACHRQGLSKGDLIDSISRWSKTDMAVIGDSIVDQYTACEALGMSAEAPVIVVKELASKNFIGAAAIVAAHIKSIGPECSFISVCGEDEPARFLRAGLRKTGIREYLVADDSRPTTFKKRYIVENQKLFRVSRLSELEVCEEIQAQLMQHLRFVMNKCNGLVVSDFVYGVVTEDILSLIEIESEKREIKLFADIQCSSQYGSIEKFKGYDLLCPNERELRLAMEDKGSGLEILSQRLLARTKAKNLLVKLSAEGFVAYSSEKGSITSQAFPALSVNPVDVAGAGDSVLAVMSTGLSSGERMMKTAAIACCMAQLSVESMGNQPIDRQSLINRIIDLL
jgi:rfaE bifunctional protein kinase chain/domain